MQTYIIELHDTFSGCKDTKETPLPLERLYQLQTIRDTNARIGYFDKRAQIRFNYRILKITPKL